MSLINDALKQANQIPAPAPQAAAPRAVGVDRRPTPENSRPPWIALVVLPFALTVVLLLAALFLREWWLSGKQGASAPEKNLSPAAQSTPAAQVESVKTVPAVANDPGPATINAVEASKPVTPSAPTFKLQGISYSSVAPSAIINGTSVFVGDEVSGATITKIEQHAVTLQIGSETKILKMR